MIPQQIIIKGIGDKIAAILQTHFKKTFHERGMCFFIWMSLGYLPKGPIDNMPALMRVMAWHRTGDRLLPEPMFTQHTCITRPQDGGVPNMVDLQRHFNGITQTVTGNILDVILLVLLTKSHYLFTQWLDSKGTVTRHLFTIPMS